jgi:eukaryotic-like serine/threonine-protein kinase
MGSEARAAVAEESSLSWLRGDAAAVTTPHPAPGVKVSSYGAPSPSGDDPECIECRPASLEAPPAAGGSSTTPFDLQEQAAARLGIISGVLIAALLAVTVVELVIHEGLGWPTGPHLLGARVSRGALAVLSIAALVMTRLPGLSTRRKLDLGGAYEVLGACIIAIPAYYCPEALQTYDLGHITWLSVWIVLFPLVVPKRPLRAAVTSFLAASMAPAVHFAVQGLKGAAPPSQLLEAFLPNYVAAGLAVVPAAMLHNLGAQVSRARQQLRRVGAYQLVERLGKGGMGEVWRAEHHMLARPAAIKLIRPDVRDPDEHRTAMARFEREARATASLRSPHTVGLYDFGTNDEGAFYYVMELLAGLDLETLVTRFGPLGPARTVHLLKQACESLAEAHHAGLVHRDIKPANIYVCRLGLQHDYVKILDFGLVAPAQRKADAKLTDDGFLVGTPAFMAPEMIAGDPVDGRADLYALGCVAFWLLTGKLVFERQSPMQILIDHAKTAAAPPSTRTGQPIPASLDLLVLQLLEKDPARRPSSALELARRLEQVEADLLERWTGDRARTWWEAHLPELAAKVEAAPTAEPRRPAASEVETRKTASPVPPPHPAPLPALAPPTT